MSGWWWRLRWRLSHPRCAWKGCTRLTRGWLALYCDTHAPVPGTLWSPKGDD